VGELWIIYALVFGAALLGVQAGYWLVSRARGTRRSINRRLTLGSRLSSPTAALETLLRERGFADFESRFLRGANDFLAQTGLRFNRNLSALVTFGLGAAFFIILGLAIGFGVLTLMLALVATFVTVFLFLTTRRSKRIARFGEQLPDAIDVIVRGVRAGFPFSAALDLVAREMPDPVGTEFAITSDEIAFGLDLRTAIEHLYRRVGQEDLLFFVVAISIQTETGGNLAEVLSRLAALIRHRIKLRLKIKAITAEGRLSAVVLSLVPFILFGIISLLAPNYFSGIRNHPIVTPALIFGLGSLAIGNIIMYRMVHFKF
jgi:tight adherence protein B